MATRDVIEGHGYAVVRQTPSGEWLGVKKMLFTTGLFVITEDARRRMETPEG